MIRFSRCLTQICYCSNSQTTGCLYKWKSKSAGRISPVSVTVAPSDFISTQNRNTALTLTNVTDSESSLSCDQDKPSCPSYYEQELNSPNSTDMFSHAVATHTWCRRLFSLQSKFTKQETACETLKFMNKNSWITEIRSAQNHENLPWQAQKALISSQVNPRDIALVPAVFSNPQAQPCKSFLVWGRQKAAVISDIRTVCQQRFYRGRVRKQPVQPETDMEVGEPEEEKFDNALESFHSSIKETEIEFGKNLVPASVEEMSIPELSRHSYNLVPYVSRSETLQNLVKLGVNLDVVQRVEGVAELLLQSQFERDIAPLIDLLYLAGVPSDAMGHLMTKNPLLFTQSIEDLSSRIGYFFHRKFTQAEVASIITRAPVILLLDPVKLDSKLAFLKTTFNLTNQEVKAVVLKYPKVVPRRRDMIAGVRFHLKEFLTFSDSQQRNILLKEPKVYHSNPNRLTEVFDYLNAVMGISREQMMVWPSILRSRPHILRDRHLFLVALGRAQYDPCRENFVSLRALAATRDDEFCRDVAKCAEADFHNFLKTL